MKTALNNISGNKGVNKFLKRNSMILVALFILMLALTVFTDTFLTTDNILSVMRQISVVCLIFTSVILNKTKFGRGMYAIGGNKNAAIYAGIKVKRITASVFVLTGMFSALAGIIAASRVYSGQPNAGEGFECNAIAAAVLGGVSFNGGIGTAGGVMIGVMIMGFMNNGLNMLHVTSYWQIIVKGLLILLAVYLDTMRSMKRLHKRKKKERHKNENQSERTV